MSIPEILKFDENDNNPVNDDFGPFDNEEEPCLWDEINDDFKTFGSL